MDSRSQLYLSNIMFVKGPPKVSCHSFIHNVQKATLKVTITKFGKLLKHRGNVSVNAMSTINLVEVPVYKFLPTNLATLEIIP